MLLCTVKLNVCAFVCGIARYIIIAPDGYAQGLAGEKVDLSRGTTALYVCDVDVLYMFCKLFMYLRLSRVSVTLLYSRCLALAWCAGQIGFIRRFDSVQVSPA